MRVARERTIVWLIPTIPFRNRPPKRALIVHRSFLPAIGSMFALKVVLSMMPWRVGSIPGSIANTARMATLACHVHVAVESHIWLTHVTCPNVTPLAHLDLVMAVSNGMRIEFYIFTEPLTVISGDTVSPGKRTEWSPIRSVIVRVITKDLLNISVITDRHRMTRSPLTN